MCIPFDSHVENKMNKQVEKCLKKKLAYQYHVSESTKVINKNERKGTLTKASTHPDSGPDWSTGPIMMAAATESFIFFSESLFRCFREVTIR